MDCTVVGSANRQSPVERLAPMMIGQKVLEALAAVLPVLPGIDVSMHGNENTSH